MTGNPIATDLIVERGHHGPPRGLVITALTLGVILMIEVIVMQVVIFVWFGQLADRVDQITVPDPGPAITGCPFGDTECGG